VDERPKHVRVGETKKAQMSATLHHLDHTVEFATPAEMGVGMDFIEESW